MIHSNTHTLFSRFKNFIEKTFFAKPCDKRYESDRQMIRRVGRKFAVIFFVILMFDTLLDWFLGLTDFVIHLLHLIIQAIEYSLLISLEHWFQFNQQQSEMIVVNAAVIIALFLTYRFIRLTPEWVVRLRQYLQSAWLRYIGRESSRWQAMSFTRKIKCISAYSFGTTCLLFLIS